MAVFPCSWVPHRYPGPQRSIYVSWVVEHLVQTTKLRLCPRHFNDAVKLVRSRLSDMDENSQMSNTCDECGEDRTCAVFAKIFDVNAEPTQSAADFCAQHAEELLDQLHVANGSRLETVSAL